MKSKYLSIGVKEVEDTAALSQKATALLSHFVAAIQVYKSEFVSSGTSLICRKCLLSQGFCARIAELRSLGELDAKGSCLRVPGWTYYLNGSKCRYRL